jgi:hypothetical protein
MKPLIGYHGNGNVENCCKWSRGVKNTLKCPLVALLNKGEIDEYNMRTPDP